MGSCCSCVTKVETREGEYLYEGSLRNMKLMNFSEKNINITDSQGDEKILLQPEQSPLRDYSMSLFEKLNNLRSEPINYYNESVSYEVNDIVEILMSKIKNNEFYQLTWSTRKEREIITIFQNAKYTDIDQRIQKIKERFEPDYEIIIFYTKNNCQKKNEKENNEGLWNILNGIKKLDNYEKDKILNVKIDYFIIYSIYEEQLMETESKTEVTNRNEIISFFFIFYYLQNQSNIVNFNFN